MTSPAVPCHVTTQHVNVTATPLNVGEGTQRFYGARGKGEEVDNTPGIKDLIIDIKVTIFK